MSDFGDHIVSSRLKSLQQGKRTKSHLYTGLRISWNLIERQQSNKDRQRLRYYGPCRSCFQTEGKGWASQNTKRCLLHGHQGWTFLGGVGKTVINREGIQLPTIKQIFWDSNKLRKKVFIINDDQKLFQFGWNPCNNWEFEWQNIFYYLWRGLRTQKIKSKGPWKRSRFIDSPGNG